MAALTAAELQYDVLGRTVVAPGRQRRRMRITFPTGANAGTNNQYVTGGIALDRQKLGCPYQVFQIDVLGRTPAAGALNPSWAWNGDGNAPKLVAYSADTEMANTVAFTAAQALTCEVEGY